MFKGENWLLIYCEVFGRVSLIGVNWFLIFIVFIIKFSIIVIDRL